MNIGIVIEHLKKGEMASRIGWNGRNMYIVLVSPISPEHEEKNHSGMWAFINGSKDMIATSPFIAIKTADNKLVPFVASHADLLSDDWCVFS